MKNAFLYLCFISGFLLSAVSLKAETLYWIGHTTDASNPNNWSQGSNGLAATAAPGSADVLIIEGQSAVSEIFFSQDLTVKALFVRPGSSVNFRIAEGAEVKVLNGFGLQLDTRISGGGSFRLMGKAEAPLFLQLTETQSGRVQVAPGGNFLSPSSRDFQTKAGGNRGSCAFFTIQAEVTPPTCNGDNNASVTILPIPDGVGPFAYQWVAGPASNTWNNLGAGTYTVIVVDLGQGGISCSQDVFINEPGPLTVFAMQPTAPLCSYSCDGQASPLIIGGNGGYTLNWSSGETGPQATALCETFSLQITDSKGCQLDTTYTFTNMPLPVSFNPDVQHIYCFGAADGAIDLNPSGGTGSIAISWTGPGGFTSNQTDIAGLLAGDYTATAVDAEGCTYNTTITVTEFPELQLNFIAENNICPNGNDAQINTTVTGGSAPYTYDWSGPNGFSATGEDLTGLSTGIYYLTVTDNYGCVKTDSVDLSEPFEIVITSTQTDVLCFGAATGSASVSATGGTGGYTFDWAGPNGFTGVGPAMTNLSAGEYIVTLTDANLCTQSDTILLNQPDSIHVSHIETPLVCNGAADAALDITISGGVAPYAVSWSGPAGFTSNLEDITGLQAGTYTLTVTDDNNCSKTWIYEITEPVALSLSANITPTTCSYGQTGAIDLTVGDGTPPFNYLWTGPSGFTSTQEDISSLASGSYHVEVTDANGCFAEETFQVVSPNAMQFSYTSVNNECFGGTEGSIDITVTGGQEPYIYLWAGPPSFSSTSEDINNLAAGHYSLLVRDALMCTAIFELEITEPDEIDFSETLTTPSCAGVADGAINISTTGGTPPYSYSWAGPNSFSASTKDISGLEGGTYTLTVTDANGCVVSEDFLLDEPEVLTVSETLNFVLCAADTDGGIDIDISGGTAPYTTDWTGPNGFTSNAEDISGLSTGIYTLQLSDANGCTFSASYLIEPKILIEADAIVNPITCNGAGDASIAVTLSGGNEPYTINWSGPGGFSSNQLFITNLDPGTYQLSVGETNGCSETFTYQISQPDPLVLMLNATPILCANSNNAEISSSITGGVAPFSYSWSGPDGFTAATQDITGLSAGTYNLTVEDANGCVQTASAVIEEVLPIALNLAVTEPECLVNNGQLVVNPTGGTTATGNYQIQWYSGSTLLSTNDTINNLSEGNFTVVVTDDNGCSADTTFFLDRDTYDVQAAVQNISCVGAADGSVNITTTGGVAPFIYSWTGPNGFTAAVADISDLTAGTYELTVVDATGCTVNLSYDISEPAPLQFDAAVTELSCTDPGSGTIILNPAGGTPPYSVSWSGPDGFSSANLSETGLAAGIYSISLSDFFGCSNDTIIELMLPTAPGVTFTVSDVLCFGAESGAVSTITSGGAAPFSYTWSGPAGFSASTADIDNLPAGMYTLTVAGANGCQTTDSVLVNEPAEILPTITTTSSTCQNADGSADVVVTGGFGPYTFVWMDENGAVISTVDSLENVPAGLYTLQITDSASVCVVETDFTISDASGDVEGVVSNPFCASDSTGAIDITVVGGLEPFVYNWSGPDGFTSADEDLADLGPGTYDVEVTDANGCLFAELFTVEAGDSLVISAAVTNVNCFGNNGAVDVTISGGTAPYDYSWTGPEGFSATTQNIAALNTGYYQLQVTDQNLCSAFAEFQIDTVAGIEVSAAVTDVACDDVASGAIAVEISGGSPGYTFNWSGPAGFSATTEDLTGITAGAYTLEVTDEAGCSKTYNYTVGNASNITVDVTVTNSSCTTDDGSISIVINSGADPADFVIQWFDDENFYISNNDTVNGLGVGIYELYVTDSTGCTYYQPVYMSAGDAVITADITDATCGENGAIDLQISGAVAPYTVTWTNPAGFTITSEDLQDIGPGEYLVEINDAAGCSYLQAYQVNAPDPLQINLEQLLVPCPDTDNGQIEISVTGGVPEYAVAWTGPDGFSSGDLFVDQLAAGQYAVAVTDQNLCTVTDTFELGAGTEIDPEFYITNISCYGDSTGTIEAVISGGNAPYQISWTGENGFVSSDTVLTGLTAGDYAVEITDANNCIYSGVIEIYQAPQIISNLLTGSAGCAGEDSVLTMNIAPSGGTGTLTVSWSGPNGFAADTTDLDSLIAGEYVLTITDTVGCIFSDTIQLAMPDSISVVADIQPVSCFGANDGAISIEVSGGVAPYTFQWTIPDLFDSEEQDIDSLFPGTYLLLVTDAKGCTADFTFPLPGPDPVEITVDYITDTQCLTDTSGAIGISVSGGTGVFEFLWTGPDGFASADEDLSGLLPGVYSILVTDTNNCTADSAATVDYLFDLTADAGADTAVCASELPLVLTGTTQNGFEFYWTNASGDTLSHADTLAIDSTMAAGVYIFGTSNGLCSAMDTISVEVYAVPEVDAGADQEVFYEETVTLGGAPTSTGDVIYNWQPTFGGTLDSAVANPQVSMTETTLFEVVVTSAEGCSARDSVLIVVIPDVVIPSGFTPNSDGVNDLWIIDNMLLFPNNVVQVFNRWGDKVYSATPFREGSGWDGTYEGKALPAGTYYYTIELNDPRFPEPFTGPITIYR